jgi:hypothetical protein
MPEKTTLPLEAIAALRRGNKIEAIKLLREKSGLDLAEAKSVVDAFDKVRVGVDTVKTALRPKVAGGDTSQLHSGLSPGEVPRGGAPWAVALAIAVLAVLAILWARHG